MEKRDAKPKLERKNASTNLSECLFTKEKEMMTQFMEAVKKLERKVHIMEELLEDILEQEGIMDDTDGVEDPSDEE